MSRRRVITERDVRRAKADGRTSIDVGDAVVTPSAREVAGALRIALSPAHAEARPPAPPRRTAPARTGAPERSGRGARTAASAQPPAPRPAPGSASAQPSPPRAGPVSAPTAPPAAPAGSKARLQLAIGADHGGVALKTAIAKRLRELGHDVADVGTNSTDPVDYPDFAEAVARMVGEGRVALGIMIDGAGIGSCMAANKVARVRAAMCYDVTTAANAREHNFANVLTLGGGLIGERLALAIVETFIATPTGAERHAARVAKIDALDKRG